MTQPAPAKQSWLKRQYHWVILVVVFLQYFISAGLMNNLYSLFLIPVTNELNISRSAFSLSTIINCIPAFFSNLLFGVCYFRYGYRKLAVVALISTAVSYVFYTTAQTVTPFYICAFLCGLTISFISTAGISRVIADWFHRHQGLILGIVLAASGLGGAAFSLILSAIMERWGWRIAYGVSGFIYLASAFMILFLVRDTPQQMGLEPLGEKHEEQSERKKHARNVQEWDGLPFSHLIKKPYFYLMLLAIFLVGITSYIVYPTLVAHVQDLGMPQSLAAQIQGLMFLFLAAAKILEGALSDRFGAKRVMYLCVACGIISSAMLADISSAWVAILGVAIFSMSLAVPTIMLPVLTADVFGRHDYSLILGIVLAVMQLCNGCGGPIGNLSYDILGSYKPIYLAAAAFSVVSMILFYIVFRCAAKDRRKMEAAASTTKQEEIK